MGSFAEELRWLHFFALACSAISEVCVVVVQFYPWFKFSLVFIESARGAQASA